MKNEMKNEVDISKKCLLTLEEAAGYTGIGINKLRALSISNVLPYQKIQ